MKFSEVIRGWLGWCPHAQTIRAAPAGVFTVPPVTLNPPVPDGGTGGSGRIDRGIRLAIGSIKILFRNLRLLGFSLLTGLVLLFSLATNLLIQINSGANPFPGTGLVTVPETILVAQGSLQWLALTFIISLISMFFTVYLLAGLITCVSRILSGNTITPQEALSRAGDHLRPLTGWAVTGALVGTAFSFVTNGYTASIPVIFISNVVLVLFGVLTLFVVPAIALGNEGMVPAIRTSVEMFRKTWGEIIVCTGILLMICFGLMLVAMVPISIIGFSSGNPAMAGIAVILYMLVMIFILFIGSTIVGIATLGLYSYGKTDRLPALFAEK